VYEQREYEVWRERRGLVLQWMRPPWAVAQSGQGKRNRAIGEEVHADY
jgi:hypothetical protein